MHIGKYLLFKSLSSNILDSEANDRSILVGQLYLQSHGELKDLTGTVLSFIT